MQIDLNHFVQRSPNQFTTIDFPVRTLGQQSTRYRILQSEGAEPLVVEASNAYEALAKTQSNHAFRISRDIALYRTLLSSDELNAAEATVSALVVEAEISVSAEEAPNAEN